MWTGVGTTLVPSHNLGPSDCQLSLLWLRMGTWDKWHKRSQPSPALPLGECSEGLYTHFTDTGAFLPVAAI